MSCLPGIHLLNELDGDANDHGGPDSREPGIQECIAYLRELSSRDCDDHILRPGEVSLGAVRPQLPRPSRRFSHPATQGSSGSNQVGTEPSWKPPRRRVGPKELQIPAIAITGRALPEEQQEILASGFDLCVTKPFDEGDAEAARAAWPELGRARPYRSNQ